MRVWMRPMAPGGRPFFVLLEHGTLLPLASVRPEGQWSKTATGIRWKWQTRFSSGIEYSSAEAIKAADSSLRLLDVKIEEGGEK